MLPSCSDGSSAHHAQGTALQHLQIPGKYHPAVRSPLLSLRLPSTAKGSYRRSCKLAPSISRTWIGQTAPGRRTCGRPARRRLPWAISSMRRNTKTTVPDRGSLRREIPVLGKGAAEHSPQQRQVALGEEAARAEAHLGESKGPRRLRFLSRNSSARKRQRSRKVRSLSIIH